MADRKEFDDFWTIDKLLPKKKGDAVRFSSGAKMADVTIRGTAYERDNSESRRLTFPEGSVTRQKGASERGKLDLPKESATPIEKNQESTRLTIPKAGTTPPENAQQSKKLAIPKESAPIEPRKEPLCYYPKNNVLIDKVTVKPSSEKFDFYGNFRRSALIYYDYKYKKCDFAPFYSFMPQYYQMSAEQKQYYFYWRDEVRHGRFPKSDYSYVYLYAYEIINLPDKIAPKDGLAALVELWQRYRADLPVLDGNFALWIQDYCLVWQLDMPLDKIVGFIGDVLAKASFKEFFLSDSCAAQSCSLTLAEYLSDYDWRASKCASAGYPDYQKHLEGAMRRVISKLWRTGEILDGDTAVISRNAFPGLLCTNLVKNSLEIEYYPIFTSKEVRGVVTASFKYAENKLRALCGVKSRLAVKDLADEYKSEIDGYFFYLMKEAEAKKKAEQIPEYERLYDAPVGESTIEDAIRIERASWSVTESLLEGIDVEDERPPVIPGVKPSAEAPQARAEKKEAQVLEDRYGLSPLELEFLKYSLEKNFVKAAAVCAEAKISADTIAERVNEAFSDNFGDVILEGSGAGYEVIDDYKEEISLWIREKLK